MMGIIARLPRSVVQEFASRVNGGGLVMFVLELLFCSWYLWHLFF